MSKVVLPLTLILLILGAVALLPSCTIDSNGIRNPEAEARATAISQAAQDDAARRAVERQALQAEADKAKTEAEATQEAKDALVWRNRLVALGTGAGVVVLCVGLALGAVAWVNKHATAIYPNAAGLYPVVIRKVAGGVIVHDPNRALGPTTVYTTPSLAGAVAERVGLQLPQATVTSPLNASEQAHIQVTTQAQAVSLMSAVTRPQSLFGAPELRKPDDNVKLVQAALNAGTSVVGRIPQITIVNDPAKIADFEAKLLEYSGDE